MKGIHCKVLFPFLLGLLFLVPCPAGGQEELAPSHNCLSD